MYDLRGEKFGRLTVIEKTDKRNNGIVWKCQCDCGNTVLVPTWRLTSGRKKSCGCLERECREKSIKNLTNQHFGNLVVIERAEDYISKKGKRFIQWKCQCDCGNITCVTGGSLRSGKTKSCGKCTNKKEVVEKLKNGYESGTIENTNIFLLEQKLHSNNTSGYKGVSKRKKQGDYVAYITFKGVRYYLGVFKQKEDAISARKEAEARTFNEFLKWFSEEFPERMEMLRKHSEKKKGDYNGI